MGCAPNPVTLMYSTIGRTRMHLKRASYVFSAMRVSAYQVFLTLPPVTDVTRLKCTQQQQEHIEYSLTENIVSAIQRKWFHVTFNAEFP